MDPRFGGIVTTTFPLAATLTRSGRYHGAVAAFCEDDEFPPDHEPTTLTLYAFPLGRSRWLLDRVLRKRYAELVGSSAIVHIHGIWQEHCSITAQLCRSQKTPALLSAHGMLDSWALQNKGLKKRAFLFLGHLNELKAAGCLRALTVAEADDYRRVGLTSPIVVIPNGVTIPSELDSKPFLDTFPHLQGKQLLLFLGRLHPKKGVSLLVKAWAKLSRSFSDTHLVFAGPDFDNTETRLRSLIQDLGLSHSVTFCGPLCGALKWSALAASRVFVLPSFSEGFSVAVLEALAAGCLVIVSTECHFPAIASTGSGWVISPCEAELEDSLKQALQLTHSQRAGIQASARDLVTRHYTWTHIANQIADICDYLRGSMTSKPPALVFPR